ncbi:GPP34 family phosphoprotein [Kitasatospora sp. NPDC094015]|uniref:GPP34 family phosphoprotein n=1 Tax=Kitasatospora sp. NPDC094015 TaxID=3155205 RepID=UPI003323CCD3
MPATTAQDLLTVALDPGSGPSPEQGELSLALAGAELIDLLGLEAAGLDEQDRILPRLRPTVADPLLDRAAADLRPEPPYESVEDWLWRRGRGLAAAYRAARDPGDAPGHRHRPGRRAPAGSPARPDPAGRWATREPVLTTLAAAAGIATPDGPGDLPDIADDAVATVLAAVHDAVRELDAVRRRRSIEGAAFDNIWRGGGL